MTNLIDELRDFLRIDRNNLDQEIIEQPELFYRVSEAYVNAVSLRDKYSEELKQIDAEVDLTLRQHFESSGKKVTEKVIDSEVKSSGKHETASEKYLNAKAEAEKLLAIKEAFIQKSYMIRELCGIYISGYSVAETSISADNNVKSDRLERKSKTLKDSMRT